MFWLLVGAIATAAMDHVGARRIWYALLIIPFTLAGLGYFQARAHT
jgi:hypothetical protein